MIIYEIKFLNRIDVYLIFDEEIINRLIKLEF